MVVKLQRKRKLNQKEEKLNLQEAKDNGLRL